MILLACFLGFLQLLPTNGFLDLNVPPSHIPYIFSHHKHLKESCAVDQNCSHKDVARKYEKYCWGYEDNCHKEKSYHENPRDCESQYLKHEFWKRADFGFVQEIQKEMKELKLCSPTHEDDSSLVCSRNMRYCLAKNLYIDLRSHRPERDRFKSDMFQKGMIGGHCKLNKELLKDQGQHAYPLQSWFSELQNYSRLSFRPMRHKSNCDVTIDTPTVLMKLDSGINLYHHFCDFFNLYLSQHVNNSWFGQDIQIVMWDTSKLGYFDIFSEAWGPFTDRPMIQLRDWVGKRVCLSEAMFPLLARMRSGLYYNTYIPSGCVGSSLFKAFSEHFLHRMEVTQNPTFPDQKIRVTLLDRGRPDEDQIYRKIRNQDELLDVLSEFPDFHVNVVQYKWKKITLKEQLKITHNSDIFIGMHGAGLLHFLFLPDWAVAFELYNCGDTKCYHDLARLRGVNYLTWEGFKPEAFDQGKHPRYGDNPKFWNWSFDPGEFRKHMEKARQMLLSNEKFKRRYRSEKDDKKHARDEF